MSTEIHVAARRAPGGWQATVSLADPDGTETEHEITVSDDALARLVPGAEDPDDLIRRSFEFLLAREPKTSILRHFDLLVIGRYFPEYESTITRGT